MKNNNADKKFEYEEKITGEEKYEESGFEDAVFDEETDEEEESDFDIW